MNNFSRAGGSVLEVRDAPKEQAAEEIAQGPDITPPPYRAPLVPDKPEPPSKAPPNKPISRQALDAVREMIKRVSPTGKLGFTSDSERKEISDTRESPEDESSKLLVWRVRGKVFRFEKDTWVDQEYKPEMQEWRRWTLKRGSEEYKRALAAEPLLKEFFDRAPILVVWKDEIYKVLK
jgi:hypothetical protein